MIATFAPVARRLAPHALVLAILLFIAAFSFLQPAFLKPENLIGILRQVSLIGIMAVCMTFVIMTGGVDLSVGPVLAISGLAAFFTLEAGWPLPIGIAAGIAVGVAVGLANGFLIAAFGLPPIIVTLAMLSIVRGTALIAGGPDLHAIRGHDSYTFIGAGSLWGIPMPIFLFGAVAAAVIFLQFATPLGVRVAAIGDNERAARLSGHRVWATKLVIYALSSAGAAFAGIIQTTQVHTAAATYGEFGTELDVIAAVVLGGTSLSGGHGSAARTVLGVLFLGVINSGMNILNVPIDSQLIAKGVLIAAALAAAERAKH
ncbi:MAG: ABC transporter permease [Bradyrhizobium sp.]|nr:MAG: ABC transporter permease [Bradyrhizobium sp.]